MCDDAMAKPNIILIVCDTLRKDTVSKMPNLLSLAKESMVYENCISPETWTFPVHASLFTGMYASEHGVHETADTKVEGLVGYNSRLKARRLAESLQSKGYNTIGISNNFMLSRFTGFDYGFDFFLNIEISPWGHSKIATEAKMLGSDSFQVAKELIKRGRAAELPKFALEYLKVRETTRFMDYPRNKGAELTNKMLGNMSLKSDFFLFINFWELHDPYRGQSYKEIQDDFTGIRKISDASVECLKKEYEIEAKYLDEQLGRLIEMLKKRELYEDSMIIITSDHGQAFNEHGFMYHSIYLYDEIIRVPLIIKYPKSKKFRKKEGYQSLVSIPKLINRVIGGGDDRVITSDKVFSETYGNMDRPPESYDFKKDYVNGKYEKVRAAIYMDGYKLNVNGSDGVVEEFMKGSAKVDWKSAEHRKAFDALSDELARFKKKEKKFIVPGE